MALTTKLIITGPLQELLMTTRPVTLPRPYSAPAAFLRQYFYFCMSLLIAVVAVYGFSQTIGQNLLHASPLPPFVLTIHAIVFPGWILFFILQSALVRTRNVPLHRTLGWFGLALGIGILVLGYITATVMDRFFLQQHKMETPAFLIIQLMDLVSFAIPFALAIYWRRRPEYHRRLILIASCGLTDAAFGRFPQLPLALSPGGVDALILLGILRDLIVDRRIHKVYLYAFPLLLLFQIFCMQTYLHTSPWWVHIATALLR
jgi:hypothetical protein